MNYINYINNNSDTSDSDIDDDNDNRFKIILCELYNELIHGKSNTLTLYNHYLVISSFKNINDNIFQTSAYYMQEYNNRCNNITPHKIFRNYSNIILNPNYIKPEIGEIFYLSGNECVTVIKTIWIRLIQRTWKKIYKQKMKIIKKRCNIASLFYKQIYGCWPDNCKNMPKLNGMLFYLQN